MWGEIAYQLYGLDGYEYIKEYDQERSPPGENTLKGLFEHGGGLALILLDEIAAYLKAASGVEVGDTTLSELSLNVRTLTSRDSLGGRRSHGCIQYCRHCPC